MKITAEQYNAYVNENKSITGELNDVVNPLTITYDNCKVVYSITKFKEFDVLMITIQLSDPTDDIDNKNDLKKTIKITKNKVFVNSKQIENKELREFYTQKSKFIWAQFLKHKNGTTFVNKPQYRFID